MSERVEIRPITPSIGAEVVGIDVATDIGRPEVRATIHDAFVEHHVLVFRDQRLDREAHKAFGRVFGELAVHPSRRDADDPEIFVVRADADTRLNNGGLWHTDLSCLDLPPLGSALLLTRSPSHGGDTLFANMHLAFEQLSSPIRAILVGLTAVHDQRLDIARYGYEPRPGIDYPVTSHPVVVAHPVTGRPLLYVNRAFTARIEELNELESRHLLDLLFEHIASNPTIQCRVQWAPGTLVVWDNRSCQHHAVWDYYPEVREGERVTIAGDAVLEAAVGA